MDTLQQRSGTDSPMHRHFRAMPPDVQRAAIRRLALSGFADEDISARTGWSVDGVRRAILEDECVSRLTTGTDARCTHATLRSSNAF
jgi:hypothetical protein